MFMHRDMIKKIKFFQDKDPHFIASIGPLLKNLRVERDNTIYKKKDQINEIFFLIKGKAGFFLKAFQDSIYL